MLVPETTKANERCIQLSNGCGYVSLLEALQNYFLDYIREFRRVLTNVREKCRVDTSCMDAEDWSLFQNCLRIAHTCGDLILNTEEFHQQLLIDIVSCAEKYCPPTPTSPIASPLRCTGKKNPFHDYRTLLLASDGDRATFDSLVTALEEGDGPLMPGDVKQEMHALSEVIHKFAFDIVFAPLQQQLTLVSTMEVWASENTGVAITANLPTFSLSPQEYITKIGQYLMTLPQQLDPFSLEDNPALTTALRHSNLPYTTIQSESLESLADVWLESVARGTMHVYTEVILQVPQLTSHSTQQLITDIDYLVNVLDDLGLASSDNIKDIMSLLKVPVASYQQTADSAPRRLASAIAGMRSITLME
ncbi:Conserved oligomeric Golgi complex subunit 7 [Lamellibrachia satsuma]|nr:Conserved oligomeric Golgi complex subunit 7 [Lamellibrachia satsuma]